MFEIDGESSSLKTSICEDELEEMMQKPTIVQSPVQESPVIVAPTVQASPYKDRMVSARSHGALKSALKQPTQRMDGSPRGSPTRVAVSPRKVEISPRRVEISPRKVEVSPRMVEVSPRNKPQQPLPALKKTEKNKTPVKE